MKLELFAMLISKLNFVCCDEIGFKSASTSFTETEYLMSFFTLGTKLKTLDNDVSTMPAKKQITHIDTSSYTF